MSNQRTKPEPYDNTKVDPLVAFQVGTCWIWAGDVVGKAWLPGNKRNSHGQCERRNHQVRHLQPRETTDTANPAKHIENKNPGKLKKDALQPGQVIFSDQYQTNIPGKPMKTKDGAGAVQPYRGGMIFCDAASGYIHVEHQVALTSYKTIAAKVNFEQLAIEASVTVTSYHTDNGIY